jgi:gliding motility-associated-like protein
MKRALLFRVFIYCLAALLPSLAFATHNRAGEITYTYLGNLTYEFTITTYTDPNSPADRNELIIYYGDGDFDTIERSDITPITFSIQENKYIRTHQYNIAGTYTIYMQDPNRVEGITNIEGSVNVPFYLETIICIPDELLYGYNNSVQLTNPPIDYANIGDVFTHNPGAYDPDGDALRFSLQVPLQAPGLEVPGYEFPDESTACIDTFSIDSLTGTIKWNVPCEIGIYVIRILIEEFRDGQCVGKVNRDMQIEVVDNPNNSPDVQAINDTCIIAGETLSIVVTATDEDLDQTITLTATGGPFAVEESPAIFDSDPNEGLVEGFFEWNTVCNHIRNEFYTAVFKAEDDFGFGPSSEPLTDQEAWLIYVIAPPPLNVTAAAQGNSILVQWDSVYSCFNADNFLGFSVWRTIGCDSLEFDHCQRGLDGYGYDSIAFVDSAHSYRDLSVVHGQVYSYRVLAYFGERSEAAPIFTYNEVHSFPSNNACAELKRDLPIINHVSVRNTDTENGSIYLQWYNPIAESLDTLQNPGPYEYTIFRNPGFSTDGTEDVVAAFTYDFFADIIDTALVDTFLNTVDNAWSYRIDFRSNGILLGSAEDASSVFLTGTPGDNKVLLTWEFSVPWENFFYTVFKETAPGSGVFDSLTSVLEPFYTDTGLANGSEYCYRITAYGKYTAESLPQDTLINLSQEICVIPIDLEPSCAPVLTVSNICEEDAISFDPADLKNELSWTNPNNSCADDVIGYYIYYAPMQGAAYILLDSTDQATDTTYTHNGLESLAGCYTVSAIDSFYNESAQSNTVCVDNCSDYNLPNVFTPNSDGANDLYTPILPIRFIDEVDMKIFNRWGGLVFETRDPLLNWDGTSSLTGKPLEEGVYYYVCYIYEITVNGVQLVEVPLKGYIHLIRSEN